MRKAFVAALRERFAGMDLEFSIGGQISFDVFPRVRLQPPAAALLLPAPGATGFRINCSVASQIFVDVFPRVRPWVLLLLALLHASCCVSIASSPASDIMSQTAPLAMIAACWSDIRLCSAPRLTALRPRLHLRRCRAGTRRTACDMSRPTLTRSTSLETRPSRQGRPASRSQGQGQLWEGSCTWMGRDVELDWGICERRWTYHSVGDTCGWSWPCCRSPGAVLDAAEAFCTP